MTHERDSLVIRFHAAADETDDSADHDELHAAGALLDMDFGEMLLNDYVHRWIVELMRRHNISEGMSMPPPRFITAREAARRMGVHENTIRNWMDNGTIRDVWVMPVSGYRRIPTAEIDRLVRERAWGRSR